MGLGLVSLFPYCRGQRPSGALAKKTNLTPVFLFSHMPDSLVMLASVSAKAGNWDLSPGKRGSPKFLLSSHISVNTCISQPDRMRPHSSYVTHLKTDFLVLRSRLMRFDFCSLGSVLILSMGVLNRYHYCRRNGLKLASAWFHIVRILIIFHVGMSFHLPTLICRVCISVKSALK